jgi:Flp pilus assembly protein TadB
MPRPTSIEVRRGASRSDRGPRPPGYACRMNSGTTWLFGGILTVIVVAVVAWWLVNLVFGFVLFLVKLLIVLVVVAAVALWLRSLFARSDSSRD